MKTTDRGKCQRREEERCNVEGKKEGWQGSEGELGWAGMWAIIDVFVSLEAKEFHCS